MDYKIVWSNRSLEDFERIINYLLKEWTKEVADGFINSTEKRLELLKTHPLHGASTARSTRLRKVVLTRQNSLYYEIRQKEIVILRIFDSRQHPRRLHLGKR